ncbi:ATP-binding protein [Streptomyces sp. NBC_01244]|uniref:ATP-binding protein n=1 Tax=Streptomyces sp. NBC_01244 TaxID=2903797 RepID=UPI002E12A0DE|nr:ATP-binding protein [Streptomyces sp. NBC_01244]
MAHREALVAELNVIRALLRSEATDAAEEAAAAAALRVDGPTPLDEVTVGFGLTAFERAVLLLAAGPELVAATADDIAAAGGDPRPTFGLALSRLPEPHWSALTPAGPLRRWHLLHMADSSSPTRSPLVVPERLLHHLVGAGHLDAELARATRRVTAGYTLTGALREAAAHTAQAWADGRIVVLSGTQPGNLTAVATEAARTAGGRRLHVVAAEDLPRAAEDRERFLRLMERESVLEGCAWAMDLGDVRPDEVPALLRATLSLDVPVVVLGHDMGALPAPVAREAVRIAVPRLGVAERTAALEAALEEHCGPEDGPARQAAAAVAGLFDLSVPDLDAAAEEVARGADLWTACRMRARAGFSGVAQVVESHADWSRLVLPEVQLEQLRALVGAVRHRNRVLEDWGFAAASARGLGTTALFAGPSGTGKTLAAEVIAKELGLDLVVVDLSRVVSKYIGETEKNLARIFEAAEDSAAVLLFDEADALFGRRTEVRDSHDRYANLEVGYLLQRMESFRGLAVLTTNTKGALDQAFLRRLRVVVTFPYPDPSARAAMWARAFPAGTPTEGLDPRRLAAVDLPGGGIAAAALTAAFLGAERGEVSEADVAAATRWELAKSGRSSARP